LTVKIRRLTVKIRRFNASKKYDDIFLTAKARRMNKKLLKDVLQLDIKDLMGLSGLTLNRKTA